MADLYVLYLRSYTETLRWAAPAVYQTTRDPAASTEETAEEVLAVALGVEDAQIVKSNLARGAEEEDRIPISVERRANDRKVERHGAAASARRHGRVAPTPSPALPSRS